MAKRTANFVNDHPLHLTKREMHRLVAAPRVWIGLVATGVVMGLAAPFGSGDDGLGTWALILYWIAVASSTYLIGYAVTLLVTETLERAGMSKWSAVVPGGLMAGLANFATLLLLNWAVFGLSPADLAYLLRLGPKIVVITLIVAVAITAVSHKPGADPQPPAILDRLPFDKRGPLISLSVQDHYVEVTTRKGHELILLRLSDALREVGDTPGLQVHRSHWIALDAVRSVRRDGARAIVTLTDGRDIPVSRTYVPAIKKAGLLPR